jgi:hypothetical protein
MIREVFSNVCCSVSMNHVLLSRTCLVDRIFIFRLQFSVNFIKPILSPEIFILRLQLWIILAENAVRNFEVEIKLLKNKAIRYELKFKQIDNEMFEAFTSKFNPRHFWINARFMEKWMPKKKNYNLLKSWFSGSM